MKQKIISRILGIALPFLLLTTAFGFVALAVSPSDDEFLSHGVINPKNQQPDTGHTQDKDMNRGGWPADSQSTTGPQPPAGLPKGRSSRELDYQVVIPDVPAYEWYRGCGPTAAGMVIGYWDGNGFEDLVTGSADTQTGYVDDMISSQGN